MMEDRANWGDPHLVTFDRLAYDFQAVGEFILVQSLDDSLEIQTPNEAMGEFTCCLDQQRGCYECGGDRVGFYVDRTPGSYLNGSPTTL